MRIPENLLVYATLLEAGFSVRKNYRDYLDTMFSILPDNDLLLELQWCTADIQKTISTIREYYASHCINYDVFGRELFSKLEKIYEQDDMDIQTFGEKTYRIWQQLSSSIHLEEPFFTLCYADDPLSWGDEKQARNFYEKAFRFYSNIE